MEDNKTVVIILGTLHLGLEKAPEHVKILRQILTDIKPDVICGELSPEGLQKIPSSRILPEYTSAILPYAIENEVVIIPLEPSDNGSFKSASIKKQKEAMEEIKSTDSGKAVNTFIEKLANSFLSKLVDVIKTDGVYENLQRREYDLLFMESWYEINREYLPRFDEQWNEWNEYFLSKIEGAISNYRGKRILVTVGLDHKYWLWRRLEMRDDIILHNLLSFNESTKSG